MEKGAKLRSILFLHASLFVFSLSGVCLKAAAMYPFLSAANVAFYVLAIGILGIYAILWQRILQVFPLSFAYANRGVSQIWMLVWGGVFFSETIKLKTIMGVAVVICGVLVLVRANDE